MSIVRWLYHYRAIAYAALIPLAVAHAFGSGFTEPPDRQADRLRRKRQRALDRANGKSLRRKL